MDDNKSTDVATVMSDKENIFFSCRKEISDLTGVSLVCYQCENGQKRMPDAFQA